MDLMVFLNPLLKWWWLILTATLLAAGASYLATREQPLLYESRATLMIGSAIEDPNPTNMEFTLSQQLSSAYADIARRAPVRQATMEALGLTELPDFSVQALPNTQLLEIVVLDTNPQRSHAVANELANQLLGLSPSGLQSDELERQQFIDEQLDALQAQIETTETDIETLQEELGAAISAQQIEDIQNQLGALQTKLTTLQSTYTNLLSTTQQEAINALTIIEPARLPQRPQDPNIEITILTAAAIGFTIAVSTAYLLEYLDDRVKTIDHIRQTHNLPALAVITTIKEGEAENGLITISNPRSPISEAFRALRTNLQHANEGRKTNTILITSSAQGEGKSVIAANLAIVLAQGGYNVLLIDADLHWPRQDVLFNLTQEKGLSTLLLPLNYQTNNGKGYGATRIENQAHLQKLTKTRLSVLTSGPIPPIPAELLGSPQMEELLSRLSAEYDFIVLDSPPVLAVTDAVVLSTMVDTVLLVVDMRNTRRNQLKHAIERLREVNAPLAGVIVNRLKHKSEGYTYYSQHLQKSYLERGSVGKATRPGKNGQDEREKQRSFVQRLNHPLRHLSSRSGDRSGQATEQQDEP
jgi:non-specific protein-tyrosine kinase